MTLAALLEARQQGYRPAILQASDLGYPVDRRLGFAGYGRLNRYLLDGAAPSGTGVESSR